MHTMTHRPVWLRSAGIIALLLILAGALFAQTNQGGIAGDIQDPTGATVANAKITATQSGTGTKYEITSTSAGTYRLLNLKNGAYDITVTAAGFKTATIKGVIVEVGTTTSLDIKLQTGTAVETVVVQGDAPGVETESSDMGAVISDRQFTELPLVLGSAVQAMRSPESFVFLTPGTIGPGTGNGAGGTFESKINGSQNYATEVLLDGASTYRSENGSSFDETAPSVDALGEFKVMSSTLPAEVGRTTGGIESFTTKQGTNTYHGSAYEIFRNDALDANSWSNEKYGRPRNNDKQHDYGGVLSGPVQIPHVYNGKNKTFFLFGWEQYKQTQGGTSVDTVPTAAMRNGDFSSSLGAGLVDSNGKPIINPCNGQQMRRGQIFDPATTTVVNGVECRMPFANNIIPTSRFSSAAKNIMNYWPTAQNGNATANYVYQWSNPIKDTTMTVRLDHNLSSKEQLFFTYTSRDNTRTSVSPWFDNYAGAGRNQDFFTHYIRFGVTSTLTDHIVNRLNLGYNRTNSKNQAKAYQAGVNWATKLGISGTVPNQKQTVYPGIGIIDNQTSGLGDGNNGDTIDNGFRINNDMSVLHGRHEFKFGVDLRHQQYSPLDNSNTSGNYYFWPQQTSGTPETATGVATAVTGNAYASFLLGQVHDAYLTQHSSQARWLQSYFGVYFQDSFRAAKNLTLNYGLRWDVELPRHESDGQTSNISLTTPNPGAGNIPGALVFAKNGSESWVNTYKKDFGPRVGFAWSPDFLNRGNHQTVVRGGYGILYGALQYADFGGFNRAGFTNSPSFGNTASQTFDAAFNLDSGFPSYVAPPNKSSTQLNGQGVQYIDPSYGRPAMVQNWSFEVQRELTTDLIGDVAYVGSHGTHLRSNFNAVNSLDPKYLGLGSTLNKDVYSPEAQAAGIKAPYSGFQGTVAQALLPFPQYGGFNTDGALENLGQSSYNSLQASLRRRFRNGLTLMASYTWSKTLTDADSAMPYFATLHGGGSAQNPFNKKGEKYISNQDTPHVIVISYVYDLPFGKGKAFLNQNKVVDKIVGGWKFSGIHRYQSGQALSFGCAPGIPGFAGCIRYDRVPGQSLWSDAWRSGHFNPLTDSMFNKNAFVDPNAGVWTTPGQGFKFGNMPRTTGEVRMPWYQNEDFNLIRDFQIKEQTKLQFTASAMDVFNRHQFNRPDDLNPADADFGKLRSGGTVNGPRILQLKMKLEF